MRPHACLDVQKSSLMLEHSHVVVVEAKLRIPAAKVLAIEHFDRQTMLFRRLINAAHDGAVRPAPVETAAFREQVNAAEPFKLVPALPGPLQQRHIVRMFKK